MLRFLFLLLPVFSFAQQQLLVDANYSYSQSLGTGYGAGVTFGQHVYKDHYIGVSAEAIKYENLQKVMIPLTATLFYSPKKSTGSISFMDKACFGYVYYSDDSYTGWFYSALYVGIKSTKGKGNPYLLAGISRPFLSSEDKTRVDFTTLSLKAGISL
jgi:hypothetical protein